jgi:hypothetical protein
MHGDQIEQQDNRFVFGGKVSKTWRGNLFGHESRTTLGLDVRNDDIRNGLFHTEDRQRLAAEHIDDIVETSASPWIENETHWTDWFRSVAGLRGDFYAFDVHNIAGGTLGNRQAALASPKLSLIFGPWDDTEIYLNGGTGFHSNDARGLVATGNPATPLPRSKGAEAGVRTAWLPGLQSAVSLWLLDLKSELVWDGDAGTNTPSGPTRRYGVEFSNFYTPAPWLTLDADYAWSHARFTDHEAAGDYVPEALVATFDGGVALHDLDGALAKFSGGLRLRYFGPRPLTQDDTVQSAATTLVYADLGYAVDERWSVSFDVFNLLEREGQRHRLLLCLAPPGREAFRRAGHPHAPGRTARVPGRAQGTSVSFMSANSRPCPARRWQSCPVVFRESAMWSKSLCVMAVLFLAGPALAQTSSSACQRPEREHAAASPQHVAARQAMHQACAADLAKYCANVPKGCGRPMQCLKAHESEVSGQCAQAQQNLHATRS